MIVEASLRGLPPGFHGFHIHATGECERPSPRPAVISPSVIRATRATPATSPCAWSSPTGSAELPFATDRIGSPTAGAEGRAVIVPAAADNYGNVPSRYAAAVDENTTRSGDAGDRIGCG